MPPKKGTHIEKIEHKIKLEKILTREKNLKYPICIKGKRACPPESCEGPWGYHNFLKAIKDRKMVRAPWCRETSCEDWIKDKSGGAKSINIPFDQPKKISGKCTHCGKTAKCMALFAKSY